MNRTVAAAFRAVPRELFLPETEAERAGWDAPLPIGFGQTNSQPTTVEHMLGWLEVEPGNRVLDVGSGSGWTTALLGHLAGPKGHVVAVEVVPELVEFGRRNCEKAGMRNVEFHQAGKVVGFPSKAPYDRILVSAAASDVPPELIEQLAPGGQLVIPVHHDILVIHKNTDGSIDTDTHPGYVFVPLIYSR